MRFLWRWVWVWRGHIEITLGKFRLLSDPAIGVRLYWADPYAWPRIYVPLLDYLASPLC